MIKAVSTVPMEECCGWKNEGTGCCRTHTTGLLLAGLSLPCAAINLRANLFPTRKVQADGCGRASNLEGKLAAARVSAGNFPELRSCGGGGKMDGGIMRRRRRKRLRKLLASKFVFSPGEGRRQIVRGGPPESTSSSAAMVTNFGIHQIKTERGSPSWNQTFLNQSQNDATNLQFDSEYRCLD